MQGPLIRQEESLGSIDLALIKVGESAKVSGCRICNLIVLETDKVVDVIPDCKQHLSVSAIND